MTALSAVGQIVRRHDPDRFLTALFAPAPHRETLFTLYAFNHELARAREAVREPMAALIRLQWWREVVEGKRVRHEVAGPLGEALDAGRLDAALLAGLVDAREAEVDGIPDRPAFEAYVLGTAGGVMVAAAQALGMVEAEALRRPGAAFGIAGVLRSAAVLAGQGRTLVPAGFGPEQGAALGLDWLATLPPVPRDAVAAALPLVLARRRLLRPGTTVLGDRLAVAWAALRGRLK